MKSNPAIPGRSTAKGRLRMRASAPHFLLPWSWPHTRPFVPQPHVCCCACARIRLAAEKQPIWLVVGRVVSKVNKLRIIGILYNEHRDVYHSRCLDWFESCRNMYRNYMEKEQLPRVLAMQHEALYGWAREALEGRWHTIEGKSWIRTQCGQIWKPSLVPNISYNFKNAVRQNVCGGHGLQGGVSACYRQCECATQRWHTVSTDTVVSVGTQD